MAEHLLETRGITKAFPGVKALKGVDFTLDPGEIVSLCGCNGAGKSTFCSIIGGLYPQTEGEIFLNGKPIKMTSPSEAEAEGIATVHQEPSLVPRLNVVENIFLNNAVISAFRPGVNAYALDEYNRPLYERQGIPFVKHNSPLVRKNIYNIKK